jgi:hypothetical protein
MMVVIVVAAVVVDNIKNKAFFYDYITWDNNQK